MRNRFLILISLFLLNGCAETKYQVKRPFLYEVSKGNQVAYLFGTMHKGVIAEDLPESFWWYFGTSDAFVAEVDLQDKDALKAAFEKYYDYENANEAHRAIKKLPAVDYVRVENILKEKKPELVPYLEASSLLAVTSLLYDLADDPEVQKVYHGEYVRLGKERMLDRELTVKARNLNKPIEALDDINSPAFMECIYGTPEKQVEMVKKLVKNMAKESFLNELLNLTWTYRRGDEEEIKVVSAKMDKCIIENRNKLWITKIDDLLKKYKRPFIAVGVSHIEAQNHSLISLLKERGWTVRRMNEVNQVAAK